MLLAEDVAYWEKEFKNSPNTSPKATKAESKKKTTSKKEKHQQIAQAQAEEVLGKRREGNYIEKEDVMFLLKNTPMIDRSKEYLSRLS